MATPQGNFGITAPMAAPDWEGVFEQIDKTFIQANRRKLTAFQLFAGTQQSFGDIGYRQKTWREIAEMAGVKFSGDWPTPSYDGTTYTTKSIRRPFWIKSLKWGNADLVAFRREGLDKDPIRELAWAMRKETNKYLYFGSSTGFGPSTGLLNNPDVQVVDNSSNWRTTPRSMITDISDAYTALTNADLPVTNGVALLTNPAHSYLFDEFLDASFSTQVVDKLKRQITVGKNGEFADKDVPLGKAYLIDMDRYFEVLAPTTEGIIGQFSGSFGLESVVSTQFIDERTKSLEMNWINSLTPRVIKGNSVVELRYSVA